MLEPKVQQPITQVVNVAGWKLSDDYPVFPVGSKPKQLLVSPSNPVPFPFLVGAHHYLFKIFSGWQAHQLWSEVIAYELSRTLGNSVPPAFVAVNDSTGEIGALVEFFLGYPDEENPPRLVHGIDVLQRYEGPNFNRKQGRPHTVLENLRICRHLGVPKEEEWWAATLAFDALIGNTDRHPENWGFLVKLPSEKAGARLSISMAPVFDNGTSLGYEQQNERLANAWPDERIENYVRKGTHHAAWEDDKKGGGGHIELCGLMAGRSSAASAAMGNVIRLGDSQIDAITGWCSGFDIPIRFTAARAAFVSELLRRRRDALAAVLGS